MKFHLSQIAELIGAEIEGNEDQEIDHLAKIEEGEAGSLTFLANPKYAPHLYTTRATAVIIARDFVPKQAVTPVLLRVENPYSAFSFLLEKLAGGEENASSGVDPQAFVAPSAEIGEGSYVGAFSYLSERVKIGRNVKIFPQVYIGKDVVIGDNTIIYPQVSLYRETEIGPDCIIHAGTRIGCDGFGFAPQQDGSFRKVPQTGKVIIEEGVEIGANTCIDRATIGATRVRKHAKLDNLIQLAHNVSVGENTLIAAQTGVSGSTTLEENCMVGGQVGFVGHIQIAAGTRIDAQSGVNRSIKEPGMVFRGSPIQPYRQQLKTEVMWRKLEEMNQKIVRLEKELAKRG
jgi:UDP-3-O-[3-hydroxymyristoyl] glucosamine N-acyltransferase